MTRALAGAALMLAAATSLGAQEPVTREGYVAVADGVRLFWRAYGAGGDTIVMLHGGPGGRLDTQLPNLIELARDRVVLGYDQRGSGRSEVRDTLTITAARHVDDLEALRQHFGMERLTLFGHSWGSGLAVLYAERHPDHVERLILNGPMPPARDPFDEERRAAVRGPKLELCTRDLGAAADSAAIAACLADPEMTIRLYWADTLNARRSRGGPYDSNRVASRNTMRSLGAWDFRPAMRTVRVPVLVVEGSESVVPIGQSRVWAETIPDARLLIIEGAGHAYAMVEQPSVFFGALRMFLDGEWPDGAVDVSTTSPHRGPLGDWLRLAERTATQ